MRGCAKIWLVGIVLCVGLPILAEEHEHSAAAHGADPQAAARAAAWGSAACSECSCCAQSGAAMHRMTTSTQHIPRLPIGILQI